MRIPSQFNEDNLYRRGARRHDSGDSLRRIIRMSVVLVLLVFVMGQAAKPGVYEVFFGVEPEFEAETVGMASDGFDATLAATQQQRVRDLSVTEPCRELARVLTRTLSLNEQRQWTVVLARWNSGKPFPLMGSLVDQSVQALGELSDVDESQRDSWKKTLEKFGKIYGDSELIAGGEQPRDDAEATKDAEIDPAQAELSDDDAVRLVAWFNALDLAALDRVVDGSVWRSADFDAFYLQLEQADSLSSSGAVTTAVVPLLQQPEIYRGQLVRVSGLIAKADRLDASANPHSIDDYWQLWIKPDTGGDRPMVFIVPGLPSGMAEAVKQGGKPTGRFVGRFFKRLAYRSRTGAEVAPVMIGRVLRPTPSVSMARAKTNQGDGASNKQRFLMTLLIASVIGVSLAAIAMWRTSVAARRSRELRARRQRPDEFLDDLSQADMKPEPERES